MATEDLIGCLKVTLLIKIWLLYFQMKLSKSAQNETFAPVKYSGLWPKNENGIKKV